MNPAIKSILLEELKSIKQSPWVLSGPKIRSRECNVYQARNLASGQKIALKLYKQTPPVNAAKLQFEALQFCKEVMADNTQRPKTPAGYFYNREHGYLAMDWVEGPSLFQQLWNPLLSIRQRLHLINMAGEWLRNFHDLSRRDNSPTHAGQYLRSLDKYLARTDLNGAALPEFFLSARNKLKELEGNKLVVASNRVRLHGDFTPGNLKFGKEGIYALDIWANREAAAENDICRMLTYLSAAYPLLGFRSIAPMTGKFPPALMAFIEGYGTDRIDPESQEFRAVLLGEFLRRWLVITSRRENCVAYLKSRYQLRQIKREVATLLQLLR